MTCTSTCMIGGGSPNYTLEMINLLKPYPISVLSKLFKTYKMEYDEENEKSSNITLFTFKLKQKLGKKKIMPEIKKWLKKNEPKKTSKKSKLPKEDTIRNLKNRVKHYQKNKDCNVKLNSKKAQLKDIVNRQDIKLDGDKITVKVLRDAIRKHKKEHCIGLSGMNKKKLINFINIHNIPVHIKFGNKVRERLFTITTPEKDLEMV